MTEAENSPESEQDEDLVPVDETLSPEEQAQRKARTRRRLQELDELSPPYRDTTAPPGLKLAALLILVGGLLGAGWMLAQSLIRAMDHYNQRIERMAEP